MSRSMSDEVKQELVKRQIQLWKPPYYGVKQRREQLSDLAKTFHQPDALEQLKGFRDHALDKLRKKKKLLEEMQFKLIGLNATVPENVAFPQSWAEQVEFKDQRILKLHHINPQLTVSTFSLELCELLQIPGVKLVHKGKQLDQNTPWTSLAHGTAARTLCLVQPPVPEATPDETLIDSIRNAARHLRNTGMLDITDTAGNLIPMQDSERLAFLTALGLHALGKQRMERSDESALPFLLEADLEWNRLNESWRDCVDNYGLLQLDIGWLYLKLQSLDNLPNNIQRLDRAEVVLRKQVHSNFVTLAVVQADMGQNVPAVAAAFVRLFLLQGVAYHHSGNMDQAKERLDWAWGLAKSLRAASPPTAVAELCEAVSATPFQAISALRRSNGNVNQAALLIEEEHDSVVQKMEVNQKITSFGLCENGQDYVDWKTLGEIQTVLGLGGDDEVAGGLLRLSNNDMERAIDIYQDCLRDRLAVLTRTVLLDSKQGVNGRKRSRQEEGADDATTATESVRDGVASARTVDSDASLQEQNGEVGLAASATGNLVTPPPTGRNMSPPPDDPVDLLQRALGEALEQDGNTEGCLGHALNEEWGYIEQYRNLYLK